MFVNEIPRLSSFNFFFLILIQFPKLRGMNFIFDRPLIHSNDNPNCSFTVCVDKFLLVLLLHILHRRAFADDWNIFGFVYWNWTPLMSQWCNQIMQIHYSTYFEKLFNVKFRQNFYIRSFYKNYVDNNDISIFTFAICNTTSNSIFICLCLYFINLV